MADLEKQLRDQEVRNVITKLKAGKTLTARESQLANDYAREMSGGSRFLTGAEIGKLLGISRQAGDKKVRGGCLVRSFEELVEWERTNNRQAGAGSAIIEARRRKIELETERLRIRIEIDKGQMIDRDRVREAGVAAGAALVAELSVLANELPGQLAGLGELDIRDRLLARIDILVRTFRERLENLKFDDETESAD